MFTPCVIVCVSSFACSSKKPPTGLQDLIYIAFTSGFAFTHNITLRDMHTARQGEEGERERALASQPASQAAKQADRQTDGQAARQPDRQTDGQTDSQSVRHAWMHI